MEYEKIISVTGLPGLYELVSSKSDGAIVRSLDDKSTRFVSSRIHNFSHLESIEVYTTRENVNLVEVFKAMEASSAKLPDEKDNGALRKYFETVYPEMDFERVYASDMKKMVKWFSVLKANNIDIKLREPEEEEQPQPEPVAEEAKPIEKKAATTESKKAEKPAKETKEVKEKAKEPAKKAEKVAPAKTTKKESEEKKAAPKKKAAAKTESKKETPAKKKAATKKSAKKK
jgi:hypothetical protein